MRSGIGNCTELVPMGIECVKDSIITSFLFFLLSILLFFDDIIDANVGMHLTDHAATIVSGLSKKVDIISLHKHW